MTPLEISVLLHYYYSVTDVDNLHASAVQEAITKFIKCGLLFESQSRNTKYEGKHEALKVYVDKLCSIPLPRLVQKWVIPNSEDK